LADKPGVHGIDNAELLQGPAFVTAFERMIAFIESIARDAVSEDSDSSQEIAATPPHFREAEPNIVLLAHNGLSFDYPMLVSECRRHKVSWAPLERWLFVDTLVVLRAVGAETLGGCLKLQCLARDGGMRAHRALDDSIALAAVMKGCATSMGVSVGTLISSSVVEMDAGSTAAQLSALLA